MANVFSDSFDSYANAVTSPGGLSDKWTSAGAWSTSRTDIVTGHGGNGRAARLRNSGGNGGMTGTLRSGVSAFSLNFSFMVPSGSLFSASMNTYNMIHLMNGSTFCLGLGFETDGSININRTTSQVQANSGAQLCTTAPGIFVADSWYSACLEGTIHDTTGRLALYVDSQSASVCSATNVDTNNGVGTVNAIRLGHAINADYNIVIDNLWMSDSDTRPANFLRAETLMVNGDGGTLNFTPSTGTDHYAVVDEAQVNAADYLSGSNIGDFDELLLANMATNPQAIADLVVFAHAAKTDAAAREMALGVYSNTTNSDGSNFPLNATGSRIERSLITDPHTAAAWLKANVDALKLRPKVTV